MDGTILPKLEPEDGENTIQSTDLQCSSHQRINDCKNLSSDDSKTTVKNIKSEFSFSSINTLDKGLQTNNSVNVKNSIIKKYSVPQKRRKASTVHNNYEYLNEPNFKCEDTLVSEVSNERLTLRLHKILKKCATGKNKPKTLHCPTTPNVVNLLRNENNKIIKNMKNTSNTIVKMEILSSGEDETAVEMKKGLFDVNYESNSNLDLNDQLKPNIATECIETNKTIPYNQSSISEKLYLNSREVVKKEKIKEEIENDLTNPIMEPDTDKQNNKKISQSHNQIVKIEFKDEDIDIEETKLNVDVLTSVKRENVSSGPRYAKWRNVTTGGIFDIELETNDDWEDLQEEEEYEAEVAAAQLEMASAPLPNTRGCVCDVLFPVCTHRPMKRPPR